VQEVAAEAQGLLSALFAAYRDDPRLLPDAWQPQSPEPLATLRAIGDFMAGMTDRYAVKRYEELVGSARLPEGF
jgi:dGTPase